LLAPVAAVDAHRRRGACRPDATAVAGCPVRSGRIPRRPLDRLHGGPAGGDGRRYALRGPN